MYYWTWIGQFPEHEQMEILEQRIQSLQSTVPEMISRGWGYFQQYIHHPTGGPKEMVDRMSHVLRRVKQKLVIILSAKRAMDRPLAQVCFFSGVDSTRLCGLCVQDIECDSDETSREEDVATDLDENDEELREPISEDDRLGQLLFEPTADPTLSSLDQLHIFRMNRQQLLPALERFREMDQLWSFEDQMNQVRVS